MNTKFVASSFALALVLSACGDDNHGVNNPSASPAVTGLVVTANDNNALSAIATLDARSADSARVVYWTGSDPKQSTPFSTSVGDAQEGAAGRLVVLGLLPSTEYNFFVEAAGKGATVTSDTVSFTTGALPAFLQSVSLTSQTPASFGYIFTSLWDGGTAYVTAFDSVGRVAWYRAFPGGQPALEIKQQANGDFTTVLTTSHGGEPVPGQAVEVSPDGALVRTFTAPANSYLDGHEFLLLFDNGAYDGALMLAYTVRHLDLSAQGGEADTLVTGHQLVRQDANGDQHVVFDAWEHFQLTDNVEPTPGQLDFDHPNAISIAPDGNYVVSWRDLDIITKIDAATGALIWTLASPFAARASDFTIAGDALTGFSAQHSVRVLENGNLLVFDNGTKHAPSESRAVEYHLDESARTATAVFDFRHAPPLYTPFTGSVQRFANGNTLVGYPYGTPTLVATEVTPDGAVTYEGTLVAGGS
ncbi:MAG TPA: aryl-sulfate sulfotransferase, partial [Gemmatimonadaceae bacterium]|nr:aryl-sulfate sulfotransferase [Gemmatimonadaceae bacterium]